MKPIYLLISCFLLIVIMSMLFPNFQIGENTANALYTITGIMFSIGLSLTVISNTANVKNKEIKDRIRHQIKSTRNHFIFTFLFASAVYILYVILPNINYFSLNRNWGLLVIQCSSILYFIYNFIAIQRFNEQIEDATS